MDISDRIHLQLSSTDENVLNAIRSFQDKIAEEVLANQIDLLPGETKGTVTDINGVSLGLHLA